MNRAERDEMRKIEEKAVNKCIEEAIQENKRFEKMNRIEGNEIDSTIVEAMDSLMCTPNCPFISFVNGTANPEVKGEPIPSNVVRYYVNDPDFKPASKRDEAMPKFQRLAEEHKRDVELARKKKEETDLARNVANFMNTDGASITLSRKVLPTHKSTKAEVVERVENEADKNK
ncbi:MAG TPA: hypothetical protein VM577_07395 [Anaerovoracaceae bacterium]|nr:hypothetical protein [Anaerovoracaceae bacterium]